jgi:hypothetical protein
VVVASALALTLGFAFWTLAQCRSADAGSAHT